MLVNNYLLLIIGMASELIIAMCLMAYIHNSRTMPLNQDGTYNRRNLLLIIIAAAIGGCATSRFFTFDGEYGPINLTNFIAVVAGLIAGPVAGMGTGLIIGVEKLAFDGWGSLPFALAVIISGAIGGYVWRHAGKKFPDVSTAVVSMILCEVITMALVFLLTPERDTVINAVMELALVQSDILILCMIIFSMLYSSKILRRTPDD